MIQAHQYLVGADTVCPKNDEAIASPSPFQSKYRQKSIKT